MESSYIQKHERGPVDVLGTANQIAVTKNSDGTITLSLATGLDALQYKGVIDCSGNPNYPAADAGHVWKVSVAGCIGGASGPVVQAGDVLICCKDGSVAGTHAAVGSDWNIIQSNVDIEAATAENDFLVGGPSPFGWTKKTLSETQAILASRTALDAVSPYSDVAGSRGGPLLTDHASDKRTVTYHYDSAGLVKIGASWLALSADVNIVIPTDLDTGSVEAGKDYYVYACDNSGMLVFKVSLASTYPAGFTAATSRKIGGFHTLCASAGTISGHPLSGYVAGDIIPYSIWDLKHRARCGNNAGMRWVPQDNLWDDIYLASDDGAGGCQSVYGGTILDTIDWNAFVARGAKVGKRLLWDAEFQIAADGANEQTNIAGSVDPVTTGGHSDTAGRRMISNTGGEDECGAMWQWTSTQSYRWDSDGTMAAASKTATAYHAASPGGSPIYVKYGASGRPYLCCNMATDAVSKWITFGSAITILLIHDADAATGGYQVYFDEDATQPGRLLCALPGGKSEYLDTSDPNYPLKITYSAAPATPGVALYYDDGADERLEFTSPTSANGTIDLASYSQTWGWYSLPGSKGQLYRQGPYGDVKLLAGGVWNYGTYCGSRARVANDYRWNTSSSIGARFASEPL